MPDRPIKCKVCGEETYMLETRMCDRCWELSARLAFAKRSIVVKLLKATFKDEPLTAEELANGPQAENL